MSSRHCGELLGQRGYTSTAVNTLSYRHRSNMPYSHQPLLHRPPDPALPSPCQTCHHENSRQCSKQPLRLNPTKKEVFKATKQSSKSYGSQLASAGAKFKAVTWKQVAPYHPHGLPSPLTLHLLKGDSRTMSVPLCLCNIVLKMHSALCVYKWILSKRTTFL